MLISNVRLKNWRNFRNANVQLRDRMFIAGPNACGKSNFLDVFRFLCDIAKPGGGLQKAIRDRGGLSKIRCLSARSEPEVEIEIEISDTSDSETLWRYSIGIKQQPRGNRLPYLDHERIWKGSRLILDRPDQSDEGDVMRLTQTHLEQISANQEFREVSEFFVSILYMHLIPQLLRNPEAYSASGADGDPFGRDFLERVAKTPAKTRLSRLKKIEKALVKAVPQLKQLRDTKDEAGVPHLEAVYEHWRPQGAKQREDQFSDGTLRLIGLLWCLLETKSSLLLLEEPELSLNAAIVEMLPRVFHQLLKNKKNKQIILSTHSAELLSDRGIGGEDILIMTPDAEGTDVKVASSIREVRDLLENGFTPAEVIMPRTAPKFPGNQGLLFDV